MAEHIQIGDVAPRIQYTGDGAQTQFTYPFPIFTAVDMEVYLDATKQASGYTVNGAGQSAGGEVIFDAAPAAGVRVTLRRRLAIARTSDFQESGEFRSKVINDELDYLTAALQQVSDDGERALRPAATDPTAALTLPDKAARANMFLAFDADGQPIASDAGGPPGPQGPAGNMDGANNLSELTNTATARSNLGLVIGTDVLAPNGDGSQLTGIGAGGIATNLSLAASIAANALTIAIKTWNGSDSSASSIVKIPFRSATVGAGTIVERTLTAATSLVVSSGSTLGATSATAFRLWVVAFDDAGTVRLGVVKTASGTNIMALRDDMLASSTAEGGAGGANSAQVIYTGTAVTSKPMRILGYMDWSSGLTTAGAWDAVPTKIQVWHPGVPLPGDTVQAVGNTTGAVATGTTTTPLDDTIPQNTEGDEYMTQAITPTAAVSILEISAVGMFSSSTTGHGVFALHQDSAADALAVDAHRVDSTTNVYGPFIVKHKKVAGTTNAITFKARFGLSAAGTTTFNSRSGARDFGGSLASGMTVKEIVA